MAKLRPCVPVASPRPPPTGFRNLTECIRQFGAAWSRHVASFCFMHVVQAVPSKPTVADLSWRILGSLTRLRGYEHYELIRHKTVELVQSGAVLLNLRSGKLRAGSEDLLHVPQRHTAHHSCYQPVVSGQLCQGDSKEMYRDACRSCEVHLGHRFVQRYQ